MEKNEAIKIKHTDVTGLTDCNGREICVGDTVLLYGYKGKVAKTYGAYGIDFKDTVPWNLLIRMILEETGYDNNPCFCLNDNFVSFWELARNYDVKENLFPMVRVVEEKSTDNDDSDVCEWEVDSAIDSEKYKIESACGYTFYDIHHAVPYKHCPYCRRKIKVKE